MQTVNLTTEKLATAGRRKEETNHCHSCYGRRVQRFALVSGRPNSMRPPAVECTIGCFRAHRSRPFARIFYLAAVLLTMSRTGCTQELPTSHAIQDQEDLALPGRQSFYPHSAPAEETIAKFLRMVEQYSSGEGGRNCTAGTELNLGDGVVQQYGVLRFRAQAGEAVNRANLLTRVWTAPKPAKDFAGPPCSSSDAPADSGLGAVSQNFFFSQVVNMVESDRDIFAAGNCYDRGEFAGLYLFCPYAYRLPNGGILVKDLSIEYDYLGNDSDWFYPARRRAEEIAAVREPIASYERVMLNGASVEQNRSILLVTYDDGHWSRPYFDCGGGNIWMMTYTIPFFSYTNGTFRFKGTSGIDIDLQKVDINQCPTTAGKMETNVFANSSRCLTETTECVPVHGLGFRRGSYKCVCKPGFYFPLVDLEKEQRYYNGVIVENEYEKYAKGERSDYILYQCLPCPFGCETCEDDRPCILTLNWVMRTCLLTISSLIACVVPALACFVWHYREVKVVKASSPKLLWLILVGALFLYGPTVVSYFEASVLVCCLRQWLRAVGFFTSYGALMLKTWRISVVFRVRSARKIKISDSDLIKRLGIIVLVAVLYLTVRMIWGRPEIITGYYIGKEESLKAYQCSFNVWDYCQAGGEMLLLLWGIRLCIIVRKAPSEFNESRFISWAIYNETLLSLFLSLAMLFLQSPANPDLLYVVQFIHTNLTTTVTLVFLFGSKAYLVHRKKEKALAKDDSLLKNRSNRSNSTGMKFSMKQSSKKSGCELAVACEGYDAPPSIMQKDIEDELTRVYTELESLKRAQMRRDNPHLPTKGSTNSSCCRSHGSWRRSGGASCKQQPHSNGKQQPSNGSRRHSTPPNPEPRKGSRPTVEQAADECTLSQQQQLQLLVPSRQRSRSASSSSAIRTLLLDIEEDSCRATPV